MMCYDMTCYAMKLYEGTCCRYTQIYWCCGPYRTVLPECRIRARCGRRVGSRRRGVSRSAKGFGGTWW